MLKQKPLVVRDGGEIVVGEIDGEGLSNLGAIGLLNDRFRVAALGRKKAKRIEVVSLGPGGGLGGMCQHTRDEIGTGLGQWTADLKACGTALLAR